MAGHRELGRVMGTHPIQIQSFSFMCLTLAQWRDRDPPSRVTANVTRARIMTVTDQYNCIGSVTLPLRPLTDCHCWRSSLTGLRRA
eukprot:3831586-Rhodomonas_salina.1